MAAISINDGGTWRTPYAIYVNDGGTWRTIQQIYVNDGGTWRTVFLASLIDATMTEANIASSFFGYIESIGGSMSSTSVIGGYTLHSLWDDNIGTSSLIISGFSSDPGVSFISSCVVGGVSKTSSSAIYDYGATGAGQARWRWASTFGIDGSGTSSVVIAP